MGDNEREPLQPLSHCHVQPRKEPPDTAYSSVSKPGPRNGQGILPQKDAMKKKSVIEKFKDGTFSKRSIFILILIALGSLSDGCMFSVLAPFFPLLAEQKGASSTFTGIIFAIFQLTAIVTSPTFGNYITKIGAKFLYVSGMFLSGVGTVLFGTLDKSPPGVPFMALSFSCRLAQAVGMSGMLTAGFAMLSSEFPNNVTTVFGIYLTAEAIGLMTGPTLGGALYEAGGFGLPFFTLGTIVMLNGLIICITLPQPRNVNVPKKQSITTLLKSPLVFICFMCNTSVALGLSFLDPTLARHLERFHLTPLFIGLMFVIAPGIHATTAPLWGYMTDKKNIQSPMTVMGNLFLAIGMLCIGPCPWLPFLPFELWTIIVGLLFYGLGAGSVIIAVMKSFLLGSFELGFEDNLQTYGIVSGVYNASFSLGATIGPLLGGVLAENVGFRYGATILAGVHLLMVAVSCSFFLLRKARRRKRADESDVIVNGQLCIEESKTTPAVKEP